VVPTDNQKFASRVRFTLFPGDAALESAVFIDEWATENRKAITSN
jgi:hypothetical protein